MLTEEEAISKATAVAALLGVSKKTSPNGSGLLVFGSHSNPTLNFDINNIADRHHQFQASRNSTSSITCSSDIINRNQKRTIDTNPMKGIETSFLQQSPTSSSTLDVEANEQKTTTFDGASKYYIQTTLSPTSTTVSSEQYTAKPKFTPGKPPLHITEQSLKATTDDADTAMTSSLQQQRQRPQDRSPNPHPPLINADSSAMLSMTSIGFGIDSSLSVSQGDATEAALKAIHDAMERASLRLPISSPAQHLLQIKVQLGVPARQHGDGTQTMAVNVERLSQFLPQVIPLLPIQVRVGGLLLPSESPGAPCVCTAVACITLQSQAALVTFPPVAGPWSSSPTSVATQPQPSKSETPSAPQTISALQNSACTYEANRQGPTAAHHTLRSAPSPSQTVSLPVPKSDAGKITIPSNPLQHLNHLAIAAASSPPHPASTTTPSTSAAVHQQLHDQLKKPASADTVHRSTSMEMLAMISEQIRNKASAELQQSNAALPATATGIGSGLATAALLEEQQQHRQVKSNHMEREAIGAALLQNHGRLMASRDTAAIFSHNNDGTGSGSSSCTPVMADEDTDGDAADGDARNGNNYNYKKLPPGITTKNNQRLFVKHRYRDYSSERPMPGESEWIGDTKNVEDSKRPIRLVPAAFPTKLHEILQQIETDGYGDIIGWLPHGRSFKIHKQKEFADIILPRYFIMTKKSSFLRQLNLYSFNRFSAGPDQGSYYHEKFLRGMKFLCRRMSRQKVNGNRIRSAGNPDEEPKMALYPVCPPPSLMAGNYSVVSTMDVSTSRGPAAVLSSMAGTATMTSSLPTKKYMSEDMTVDATTNDPKRFIDEIPDSKADDNENDDYGSSEENYRTGNTTTVPMSVEARSWGSVP